MLDEDLNVVNDTQALNVEEQETPVEETSEGGTDVEGDVIDPTPEPQGNANLAPPQGQTPEENTKFKEIRQQAEQRARAEFEREIVSLRLSNPLTGKLVTSVSELDEYNRVKPICDFADANGTTFEEEIARRDRLKQEVLQNDPEYQSMKANHDRLIKENAERVFASDLTEIKKLYPEEQAKHITELGEEYFKLCASGISPLVAYEAIKNGRPKAAKPPSMGDIKSTSESKPLNKYANMSDSDFEREIIRAERGELSKGR